MENQQQNKRASINKSIDMMKMGESACFKHNQHIHKMNGIPITVNNLRLSVNHAMTMSTD